VNSILIAALALVGSFALTAWILRRATAYGLIDLPNERSSHKVATPRGGGVGIVVVVEFGLAFLAASELLPVGPAVSLFVAGALVGLVGYWDDRFRLSARTRLVAHAAAAVLVLIFLPLPVIPLPGATLAASQFTALLAFVGIVWSINLFNFMDGIDGLAGSQAVFVFGSAASLELWFGGHSVHVELLWITVAFAALGFLVWNWPPARIFMGDVGSGFIGLMVAAGALGFGGSGPLTVWTWVVLQAVFIGDTAVTILVRALHGARLHEAHRSHCYQRLSRHWKSHCHVVLAAQGYNIAVLLPLAWMTVVYPHAGALIASFALLPVICIAVWAGAGLPDTRGRLMG
jgi:Fuc2NAc and GlcNAc transferase